MTRFPHGKGSYSRRKGRDGWQIKFPLGWSDATKRYEVYNEDFRTEAEAIAALKDINAFLFHGGSAAEVPSLRREATKGNRETVPSVRQFAKEYCEIRESQQSVEERTIASDRNCLSRVMPFIGNLAIDQVSTQTIDEMYAAMRKGGNVGVNQRAYAGTTLVRTHATLSKMFRKAIDYGYRDDNPCDKATKPKYDTKEKTPLTKQQVQDLYDALTAAPPNAKSVGVLISLFCGLRLSEMLALEWSDYEKGVFRITKSLEKNKQTTKSTKNGEERVVPCPPPLAPILEKWKEQQQKWFNDHLLAWSESVPIVTSSTGNHFTQSAFSRWFARARISLPIPDDFTLHGLRHTFVTIISRDCGIDERTVRGISGHKSPEAYKIYTHTNSEWMTEAARRYGMMVAPSNHDAICQHCEYWAPSPTDPTIGACWQECGDAVPTCASLAKCKTGGFVLKNFSK